MVVSEEYIAIAILRLLELEKAVVEGAGAVGLAAVPPAPQPKFGWEIKNLTKLNLSNWHVLHTNIKFFFTCEICEQSDDWRNKEFCEGSVDVLRHETSYLAFDCFCGH